LKAITDVTAFSLKQLLLATICPTQGLLLVLAYCNRTIFSDRYLSGQVALLVNQQCQKHWLTCARYNFTWNQFHSTMWSLYMLSW